MLEFLMTLCGIGIVVGGVYVAYIKPALKAGTKIQKRVETKRNVGNIEWEKTHRAETMTRIWTNNEGPIKLKILFGQISRISDRIDYTPKVENLSSWDIDITVWNKSTRTIKYVYIPVRAYNTVGDRVTSSQNTATITCKMIGPIEPGKGRWTTYRGIFNNTTMGWVETETIKIVYIMIIKVILLK